MRTALLARLAAGIAGAGLAASLAAPALAEEPVHQDLDTAYEQTVATDHPQRCAEGTEETDPAMADLADGEAGWLFGVSGGEIDLLTVTFAFGGGEEGDPYEEVTGSPGEEDVEGALRFGGSGVHVFAPADWVLVTASAEVTDGDELVVAHTCVALDEGGEAQASEDDQAAGGEAEKDRRGLPVTGAQVGGLVMLGCGLLSAGFAMTAVRRRRDLSHLLKP